MFAGVGMTAAVDCDDPVVTGAFARWLRRAAWVVVLAVAVGLFVSTLEHTLAAVVDNLIYSECIGLSIFAIYSALRSSLPERPGPAFGAFLWRTLVAVPVGYLAGVNLAALLRGRPVGLPSLTSMAPFALAVTFVASAGTMYFFWSHRRLAEAAQAEADARRATAEARLKLLQTQIEPHMLFNTLANLRELVTIDADRAQTMIDELIVYLRGTLAASRNALTTLGEEVAQLGAYLALMKVRMGARLAVEIDLPDALRDAPIPPMLLQPIVENAIRHGLEPKVGDGTIRITVSASDDRLRIDVRDDGVGLRGPFEPGYGMTHVRERLQMLYGDAAGVTLEPNASPAGGVCARIVLPRSAPMRGGR